MSSIFSKIRFTKMQGQGNDFIVINAIEQKINLSPAQICFLADRHFGIGCDQLLLVEKSTQADVDFRYRIFNADGGEVAQCGNGARCFARFVHDQKLTTKTLMVVETLGGIIHLHIKPGGEVMVDMGPPRFRPKEIPFLVKEIASTYTLHIQGQPRSFSVLSMGNPHAVQIVAAIDEAPVALEGPLIEHHPLFPERVNAGFMQIETRDTIFLRVWERGAGETLACGTGACAAVVAGIRLGLLDQEVCVHTRGGDLNIMWSGMAADAVFLSGHAVTVFQGEIEI